MADVTDQFIISRYVDGSWSVETVFVGVLKKREAFGFVSLEDLVKTEFGDC